MRTVGKGGRRPGPGERAVLAFCVGVLLLTVAYPSGRLALRALTAWRWEAVLAGAGYEAVRNTLLVSLVSVATAGVTGTAFAFFVTRYRFPGSRMLAALAYLPFGLPPLVGVVAFLFLLGRDGFVAMFCERVFGVMGVYPRGPVAIVLVHTYSFYVFFYAMVSSALEGLDYQQLEAARTLGAGRWLTFRRVTLPLLRPALLGASLLTFMSSAASFSAPLLFGDGFPMLSVRIYEAMTQFREAEALTLTVVLAAVSLAGVLAFRGRKIPSAGGSKGAPRRLRTAGGRLAAGVCAAGVVAVLVLPHLTILALSFADHAAWGAELVPPAWTLDHYRTVASDPRAFEPIGNSLWMSAVAAAAVLLVGVPAGYLAGRRRPGGTLVTVLTMMPWALPGTVIAMNILVAFNDPWLPAATVLWWLPLAYFVRGIPLFTRMATAAIEPFDATLVEAARSLGAGPVRAMVRVVAPLLMPALVAGTALVFAMSLGEFVASILLYRPGNLPIAVQINMALRGSGIGVAFAYSVFLMVLVTGTFLGAQRASSRVL